MHSLHLHMQAMMRLQAMTNDAFTNLQAKQWPMMRLQAMTYKQWPMMCLQAMTTQTKEGVEITAGEHYRHYSGTSTPLAMQEAAISE